MGGTAQDFAGSLRTFIIAVFDYESASLLISSVAFPTYDGGAGISGSGDLFEVDNGLF
jgi:hypothetical protein